MVDIKLSPFHFAHGMNGPLLLVLVIAIPLFQSFRTIPFLITNSFNFPDIMNIVIDYLKTSPFLFNFPKKKRGKCVRASNYLMRLMRWEVLGCFEEKTKSTSDMHETYTAITCMSPSHSFSIMPSM